MQVMGDMLERIVQSSAQQSAATAPQQTAASDRNVGSGSSKPGDEVGPSAATGGANSSVLSPILPGTAAMCLCALWFESCKGAICTKASLSRATKAHRAALISIAWLLLS